MQLHQLGLCQGNVSLKNLAVGSNGNMVMIEFGLCLQVPFHDPNTNAGDAVVDGKHHHMLCCLILPQGPCGMQPYTAPKNLQIDCPLINMPLICGVQQFQSLSCWRVNIHGI